MWVFCQGACASILIMVEELLISHLHPPTAATPPCAADASVLPAAGARNREGTGYGRGQYCLGCNADNNRDVLIVRGVSR